MREVEKYKWYHIVYNLFMLFPLFIIFATIICIGPIVCFLINKPQDEIFKIIGHVDDLLLFHSQSEII